METATVLKDSLSPEGVRLITFEATFWRPLQAEAKTHAMIAGNAGSSRAIPLKEHLLNLIKNPAVPDRFGTLQPGMQPGPPLTGIKHEQAVERWLIGRDRALTTAIELMLGPEIAAQLLDYDPATGFAAGSVIEAKLDDIIAALPTAKQAKLLDLEETTMLIVHKELANRGLEAYMWITNIFTGTEWEHFFNLRVHPDAQEGFQKIARLMKEARDASTPRQLGYGEWHTPLVEDDEYPDVNDRIRVSASRCAASSYNRQHADVTFQALIDRYDGLVTGGHLSPTEHQARPMSPQELRMRAWAKHGAEDGAYHNGIAADDPRLVQVIRSLEFNGKFRGWHQHRKDIVSEHLFQPKKG